MSTQIYIASPPTVEPVTVDEFKLFARIDTTEEDSVISLMLVAVREAAEKYLGRALLNQTIYYTLDKWPGRSVELPYPPLVSVDGVYLLKEDGSYTEYSAENYFVVTEGIPGSIQLKPGSVTPSNTDVDFAGYQIRYTAGYGTTAADVPSAIRQAILVWATNAYENRVVMPQPPIEVRSSLSLYRCERI